MTPRSRMRRISSIRSCFSLRVHPRGRLVEQQQLRFARQRARDLEPALHAVGEVARVLLGDVFEPDETQQLAAPARARAAPRARCARRVQQRIENAARIRACSPVMTLSSADMNANRRMF